MPKCLTLLAIPAASAPLAARASVSEPAASTWDLAVAVVLVALALTAVVGTARLWRRAGESHGLRAWELAAYLSGLAVTALALLSPLDAASDVRFSAHMAQHELLMLVAAPLVVLGRPWIALAWSLPERPRRRLGALAAHARVVPIARAVASPLVVLALHAAVRWVWHLPFLFEAALASESVHAAQHVSFFATAALFWWSLLAGRYGRAGYGVGVAFVFLTAAHTGALGAFITLARAPWYPTHALRTLDAGDSALEDQQLAGLLMWVPAGLVLTLAALALLVAWLGEARRLSERHERLARRPS